MGMLYDGYASEDSVWGYQEKEVKVTKPQLSPEEKRLEEIKNCLSDYRQYKKVAEAVGKIVGKYVSRHTAEALLDLDVYEIYGGYSPPYGIGIDWAADLPEIPPELPPGKRFEKARFERKMLLDKKVEMLSTWVQVDGGNGKMGYHPV